jgi:hypothetical protein
MEIGDYRPIFDFAEDFFCAKSGLVLSEGNASSQTLARLVKGPTLLV